MGRYVYEGTRTTVLSGAKKLYFKSQGGTAYTWTVPTGVTCATFEIWGGGGAGAPNCCCTCYGGGAGAGGGYSIKTIAVTPGNQYSIIVGSGGYQVECWFRSNACGCPGCTTYVTGANLTNFCAVGGQGGIWCNVGHHCMYDGGCLGQAYGGDFNFQGLEAVKGSCCWVGCNSVFASGASPFGGGINWVVPSTGNCGIYQACSIAGAFPGGGGMPKPVFTGGWCDCCAGCAGAGADGLVVITL